ncbi:MAG: pyridoxamine 5'-phosphate oxidase family protein [Defluviitaleaceae bacterium]|nr:pyridoxamine 5'-phosphate oxidase family protein [Defluviitaleaceae bacterium]
MSKEVIAKASEIIKSKTAAENMGAGVVLTLMDGEGYPSTSCISISKANGIQEILFGIGISSNKGKRAKECTRASVCIFDDDYEGGAYYNITLVGDVEIVTDHELKKEVWYEGLAEHFEQGAADPDYAVLRFTTKRYNLWVDMGEGVEGRIDGAQPKPAPRFEPILIYKNGDCSKAMELYKKAFGAATTSLIRYSESDPEGYLTKNPAAKDWIMNAGMLIGKQSILVCDDATNGAKIGDHIQIVLEFDLEEEVKAAYNAMLDGATNLNPPHNAGYSPCVASLTDVYGIPWQFMVWHE